MTIRETKRRLLMLLNDKIRSGELSQRKLARLAGFTQPHIHNVLKGARSMNAEFADAALKCLNLSVIDLLPDGRRSGVGLAPVWNGEVGPRSGMPTSGGGEFSWPFPDWILSRLVEPVLLRVGSEKCMAPLIEPGDLVLIDQSPERRRDVDGTSIYVVAISGNSRLCRCRTAGSNLILSGEDHRLSDLPSRLSVAGLDLIEIVRGVVVWCSREFKSC
jgi:hypothetical protein